MQYVSPIIGEFEDARKVICDVVKYLVSLQFVMNLRRRAGPTGSPGRLARGPYPRSSMKLTVKEFDLGLVGARIREELQSQLPSRNDYSRHSEAMRR